MYEFTIYYDLIISLQPNLIHFQPIPCINVLFFQKCIGLNTLITLVYIKKIYT